jgi:hypothetical protein
MTITMIVKYKVIVIFLFALGFIESNAQNPRKNKLIGVFSQQIFYRYTIIEFKEDFTFEYHIMSERAHRQTSGLYKLSGDTIILNSFSRKSEFDFVNKKWIILSRNEILLSNNKKDKRELWSIMKRDEKLKYIPVGVTDFAEKIDNIRVHQLNWQKDTINYDPELIVIIREPLHPNKPMILMDGGVVKYDFMLNYYSMMDIDTIFVETRENMSKLGFDGEGAKNGLIIVKTKKKTKR